jgi:hypothetical protein
MASYRKGRVTETRESETRNLGDVTRLKYNMEHQSILHIPESVIRDGFEYYWERRNIKGGYDSAFERAYAKGWRPVGIERDPGRFNLYESDGDSVTKRYICAADTILLERETSLCREEREFNIRKAHESEVESNAYKYNPKNPTQNALEGSR